MSAAKRRIKRKIAQLVRITESRNKREGLYVGVEAGRHTRAKMLSTKHHISLMFCKRPHNSCALAVRRYREGVWG